MVEKHALGDFCCMTNYFRSSTFISVHIEYNLFCLPPSLSLCTKKRGINREERELTIFSVLLLKFIDGFMAGHLSQLDIQSFFMSVDRPASDKIEIIIVNCGFLLKEIASLDAHFFLSACVFKLFLIAPICFFFFFWSNDDSEWLFVLDIVERTF